MEMMKKKIMMMVELKNNVFFKITHDLEENPEISIRRDHILRGSFSTKRKLLFNEQALTLVVEPNKFAESNKYDDWIKAMNEYLDKIEKNKTWEIFPRPKRKNIVGTKWVFKNKFNEDGQVIRNKTRLVCKGYAQL